jgi:uncharacterized protein YjbI with pentapeptide repeats
MYVQFPQLEVSICVSNCSLSALLAQVWIPRLLRAYEYGVLTAPVFNGDGGASVSKASVSSASVSSASASGASVSSANVSSANVSSASVSGASVSSARASGASANGTSVSSASVSSASVTGLSVSSARVSSASASGASANGASVSVSSASVSGASVSGSSLQCDDSPIAASNDATVAPLAPLHSVPPEHVALQSAPLLSASLAPLHSAPPEHVALHFAPPEHVSPLAPLHSAPPKHGTLVSAPCLDVACDTVANCSALASASPTPRRAPAPLQAPTLQAPTASAAPAADALLDDSRRHATIYADVNSSDIASGGGIKTNKGNKNTDGNKSGKIDSSIQNSDNSTVDPSTKRAPKRTASAMDNSMAVKRARSDRARVELETLEDIRSLVECDLSGSEIAPVLQQVADTLDEYHNNKSSAKKSSAPKSSSALKSSASESFTKSSAPKSFIKSSAPKSLSKSSSAAKSSAAKDGGGGGNPTGGNGSVSHASGGRQRSGQCGEATPQRRLTLLTSKDKLADDINKRRRDLVPACGCKGGRHAADCGNLWLAYSKATIAALERVRAGAPAMKRLLAALNESLPQVSLSHVPRLRLFVSQRPQTHIPIEDRNRRNDFLNALEQEPSDFIAACVAEWQQGRAVGVERDNDEDKHYVKADLQPDDEDAVSRLENTAQSIIEEFNSDRMSDNECRAALIDALVVDNCLVRALRLGAHGKRTAAIRLVAAMGEVVSVLCGGSVICLRC